MEVKQLEEPKTNRDDAERVELELSRMEAALYDSYCEIGKVLLETAETEGRRINKLVDEIIETKMRLAAIRNEKDCPKCGACNENYSHFCKRCGQRLDADGEE